MKFYRYIAVDFDGTLCKHTFPGIGPIEEKHEKVIKFLEKHKANGSTIILWTCREDCEEGKFLTDAVNWCKKNAIPIDYVNENAPDLGLPIMFASRKVLADLYIDDKAVNMLDIDEIY